MRYDAEIAVGQMLVDYLVAVVAPAIQATCPAVSFFDPMINEGSCKAHTQFFRHEPG